MTFPIKVVSIIDSVKLKDGGPSHSLADIAKSNLYNNINHDIVHLGSRENYKYSDKIKYINLNDGYFKYGVSIRLIFWLIKNRKKYKKFFFHGLWQFQTLIARIILKNDYYVFTHGMLDPYFGKEKIKTLKKKIYWYFFERENLKKSKAVLVNSQTEVNHLKKTFVNTKGINIKRVNYGIIKPKINTNKKILKNKYPFLKKNKYILFIGRINPKKGLSLLIKSFAKIKSKKNYILIISGPIENQSFKKKLDKSIEANNLKNKIFFTGFVEGNNKWSFIKFSEFTVLPSYGENFGVSVVESLSMGKPVILSNKVGLSKTVKKYSCGIIHNLNIKSLSSSIENAISFSKNKKMKLSKASIKCFNQNYNLRLNKSFSNWIRNDK